MKRWLFTLFLGVLLGSIGTLAAIYQVRRARIAPRPVPPLIVDGEPLAEDEFRRRALAQAGPEVLQQIVQEKLVGREARRLKLALSPEEEEQLAKAAAKIQVAELADAYRRIATCNLFTQKLLLREVPESAIRQVYDDFKTSLTQYEVFVILLATKKSGVDVSRSLEDGVDFGLLVKNYSIDPSSRANGGALGFLTLSQVESFLGAPSARCVSQLKPNSVGTTVTSPHGLLILKLGSKRESYAELKPTCETLVACSRRAEFMHGLINQSKISSPWLLDAPAPTPAPLVPARL
ncbi:peptidylprolyl isomerase [bacterium]|nr:peptidylprolyl isomerase [bacterium]